MRTKVFITIIAAVSFFTAGTANGAEAQTPSQCKNPTCLSVHIYTQKDLVVVMDSTMTIEGKTYNFQSESSKKQKATSSIDVMKNLQTPKGTSVLRAIQENTRAFYMREDTSALLTLGFTNLATKGEYDHHWVVPRLKGLQKNIPYLLMGTWKAVAPIPGTF